MLKIFSIGYPHCQEGPKSLPPITFRQKTSAPGILHPRVFPTDAEAWTWVGTVGAAQRENEKVHWKDGQEPPGGTCSQGGAAVTLEVLEQNLLFGFRVSLCLCGGRARVFHGSACILSRDHSLKVKIMSAMVWNLVHIFLRHFSLQNESNAKIVEPSQMDFIFLFLPEVYVELFLWLWLSTNCASLFNSHASPQHPSFNQYGRNGGNRKGWAHSSLGLCNTRDACFRMGRCLGMLQSLTLVHHYSNKNFHRMFCILKIRKIRSINLVEQLTCCVRALSNYADPFTPPPPLRSHGSKASSLSQVMSLLEGWVVEMRCHVKRKLETGVKIASAVSVPSQVSILRPWRYWDEALGSSEQSLLENEREVRKGRSGEDSAWTPPPSHSLLNPASSSSLPPSSIPSASHYSSFLPPLLFFPFIFILIFFLLLLLFFIFIFPLYAPTYIKLLSEDRSSGPPTF